MIGTDVTGSAALGNGIHGVVIDTGASANLIGGTLASARNVIAANGYSGVQIFEANDNSSKATLSAPIRPGLSRWATTWAPGH